MYLFCYYLSNLLKYHFRKIENIFEAFDVCCLLYCEEDQSKIKKIKKKEYIFHLVRLSEKDLDYNLSLILFLFVAYLV